MNRDVVRMTQQQRDAERKLAVLEHARHSDNGVPGVQEPGMRA